MVIAHVLSSLSIGGGERVALGLSALQVAAGHRVLVISLAAPPDGPLAEAFKAAGVAVLRVPKRPGLDPILSLRLASLFRREEVDVVHTHNRLPLAYGVAAGRLAGAVVVHTRHGPGRGKPAQRALWRAAGRLLHAYVVVSPGLLDLARSLGACPPSRLRIIENGIDIERFRSTPEARRAAREAFGIPAGAFVIGSVGRLSPEKDYPLLVRAVAPLLGPEARLVIVGSGKEEEKIRAEVAAQGVEPFVLMPGARDDVARWVAAFDVFALSSRMEGLPLVTLEALAAGLPLVATAVGGLPNLIDEGRNGFLVPPGDEGALRNRLLAIRADMPGARVVGERGRVHVSERHSNAEMTRRYMSLYAEMGAPA
jgi:glycosyltransferase involved in cell wall biosynthesis